MQAGKCNNPVVVEYESVTYDPVDDSLPLSELTATFACQGDPIQTGPFPGSSSADLFFDSNGNIDLIRWNPSGDFRFHRISN